MLVIASLDARKDMSSMEIITHQKVMLEYVICLCNNLKYMCPNLNQKGAKEGNLHVSHHVEESFKGNKM
jgi:hypothetical protein